ncbi:hypothetical protein PUNSTDRAFT_139759 [Punctularia strigosozonata HHB-11173 SS5]|uniref:Uncharacterized protein n=1 Tax=Punctularia strigosozonata (strain HHB-11173) TaxID=741275 RepID=R7S1V6_PUNST|nr:uncharacterized protein PUNSTDRAFT_139759 [Punctularia strigosozonata HHB-11173 SS5]EIN03221.1 hypothetical protein PUNSTDRAFT_139759 [Punctularia strigosozonata HHB-11173 SS5]
METRRVSDLGPAEWFNIEAKTESAGGSGNGNAPQSGPARREFITPRTDGNEGDTEEENEVRRTTSIIRSRPETDEEDDLTMVPRHHVPPLLRHNQDRSKDEQ